LEEVVGGEYFELEDGIVFVAFKLTLGVVEGEGAQIIAFVVSVIDLQLDCFHIVIGGVVLDAVAVEEVGAGIGIGRTFEMRGSGGELFYTVESIYAQVFVILTLSNHIPAALKELQEIRSEDILMCVIVAEALVNHLNHAALLHRMEDVDDEILARGDALEHYPVAEPLAVLENVIHREAAEHPVLELIIVNLLTIEDEIAVGARVIAYAHSEDVLDIPQVVAERALGNALGLEIVHRTASPLLHQFLITETPLVAQQHIEYPQTLLQLVVFAHFAHNISF